MTQKKVLTPSSSFFLAAQLENFLHSIFPFFCFTAPQMTHLCSDRKIRDGSRGGKEWAAGRWCHDFCLADAVAPPFRHGEFRVKELGMVR